MAGALVVFDITRKETFDHISRWVDEIREYANSAITLFLVGNKSDMQDKYAI